MEQMEIKPLEKTSKRLVFEFKGADHTICNVLKEELWNDKNITIATYNIDHPLIGVPKFIIETNGKAKPEECLKNAIARIEKQNKEFMTKFSKIVKK